MGAFKKDLDEMYMDKAQELTEQEYGEDTDFYDLPEAEKMRIFSRAMELVHENLWQGRKGVPTVAEAIKRLRGNGKQHIAVAIWCEDDVLEQARERGISCSISEAQEIIDRMDSKQDCSIGITWDTINCYLDELQDNR